MKDALGRRGRRDTPQSTGKWVSLTERDLHWLSEIHRLGPQSSAYLHALSAHVHPNRIKSTQRLTALFHEDQTPHKGTYLSRPIQQFYTLDPRQNDLVYDLTPRAERALKEIGLWRAHTPKTSNVNWRHDYLRSVVATNFSLSSCDFKYQDELLSKPAKYTFPFKLGNKTFGDIPLIPDMIFGSGSVVFFLEVDCNTEPITSTDRRKTFERNLAQYRYFIGKRVYQEHFRARLVFVLYVTTNPEHLRNVIAFAQEKLPAGRNAYLLFKAISHFHRDHFKPPPVLPDLYSEPWNRVGLPPIDLTKV